MLTSIEQNYRPFDSDYLKENQHINFNIYYKKDSQYILAYANDVISISTIKRLKKLESVYGGLYVDQENEYSRIINLKEKQSPAFLESKRQYNETIADSMNILKQCTENKKVDKESSELVGDKINETIANCEATHIIQLINNVRNEDKYLYTHSTNVAYLNGIIGKWLKLPIEDIKKLIVIGLLHDIGKTMIPSEILNKPGVLTNEEFETIKMHPIYSFRILVQSGFTDLETLLAVRGHHEKLNGTGYPDHLKMERITLFTRITTISDIYDAMVAKRVYKRSNSPFDVLDEFSKGRYSNLDTSIVNVFLENMPKELIGKSVTLSNGEIGIIRYINPKDFTHPLIDVHGEIIKIGDSLKCLYVC